MIAKVFSIYDCKAQMYQAPFFMPAVGSAVRAFGDAVCDGQTTFAKHPSDYILFQVGEFDDNTGTFQNVVPPLQLGIGSDFVTAKPRSPEMLWKEGEIPPREEVAVNGGGK